MSDSLHWIPLLPLLGAIFCATLGRLLPKICSGFVAILAVGFSAAVAFGSAWHVYGQGAIVSHLGDWISVGPLKIGIDLAMDPLSAVMCCVVTGVGFLIHVYSLGYMAHDVGYRRYFAFLNLFTFNMLVLVLAKNLPLMFVGWEGVGLCSYLLIGFWFEDPAKAAAGKKAFIVNRIGDAAFVMGMLLLFWTQVQTAGSTGGSLDFGELQKQGSLFETTPCGPWSVGTVAAILLFIGACGKSAQLPLYVWLPDAMAGPTPVSALIHAATMVTAGVYMIVRMNFLYTAAPVAMALVAWVGAATALFAALIALTQTDIKKVLAYSTVSQLGYMFLAVGVGAFSSGIFHLTTHAFFKGLLFLGAGSVIHAMSGEQDIRKMGGLYRMLPYTCVTFFVGAAAIAGFPLLSGFFSKDEILWAAWQSPRGGPALLAIGAVTAAMTAFYMFRCAALTFLGASRASDEVRHHLHESPPSMVIPLIILAVLSVVGGALGLPHALGATNFLGHFLEPVIANPVEIPHPHSAGAELAWMGAASAVALAGMGFALWLYPGKMALAEGWAASWRGLYTLSSNKFFVDEIYLLCIVLPLRGFAFLCWKVGDTMLIDGAGVHGTAGAVEGGGQAVTSTQTGNVQHSAILLWAGAAVVLLMFLLL